jgi:hypothetical protein
MLLRFDERSFSLRRSRRRFLTIREFPSAFDTVAVDGDDSTEGSLLGEENDGEVTTASCRVGEA